ncbi:hypothetical protein [Turicimonas sp. TL08]
MNQLKINPVSEPENKDNQDPDRDNYESIKKSHKRTEWSCLHWIKIIGMFLVVGVAIAVVVIYFFHLLAPSEWCWLEIDRLEALKSHSLSIVSGLVVGLATTFIHEL